MTQENNIILPPPEAGPVPQTTIDPHPGYIGGENTQLIVTTPNSRHHTNTSIVGQMREEGLNDDQIGERLDAEQRELREKIRVDRQKTMEINGDDYYSTEDPLEGDVDRYVPSEETEGFTSP